ncbi:hypothetical protein, partial [Moorena sp. SIO3I6]|uniref:hypothetical protein n=1 Tax=Moorena sp. SIO3I6 TaxID=2607831 RepID=UPI0025FD33E7
RGGRRGLVYLVFLRLRVDLRTWGIPFSLKSVLGIERSFRLITANFTRWEGVGEVGNLWI